MLSLTLQAQNNPFKIDDELYPVEALRKKHPMYGANADIHMANMAEYLPTYCRSGRWTYLCGHVLYRWGTICFCASGVVINKKSIFAGFL